MSDPIFKPAGPYLAQEMEKLLTGFTQVVNQELFEVQKQMESLKNVVSLMEESSKSKPSSP